MTIHLDRARRRLAALAALPVGGALREDPVGMIQAIVTGVAFIGAGTVFRDPSRHRAEGLTTAAGLLAVAPIGMAVALDKYLVAVGVVVLILVILHLATRFEKKIGHSLHQTEDEHEN